MCLKLVVMNTYHPFLFQFVTEKSLDAKKKLHPRKPSGNWKIKTWALTDGQTEFNSPLTKPTNENKGSCIVPDMFKQAILTPIIKKADILDPITGLSNLITGQYLYHLVLLKFLHEY